MSDAVINPFNITKASSLDDKEIDDFWVDLPSGNSFTTLINPTSPIPMIILGGKGSGKTHILRYHSLKLQRLRCRGNILDAIRSEGYIGIYLVCSGLNSSRFSGKGQAEEIWRSVFAYYTDIWLALVFLSTILEKNDDLKSVFSKYEKDICIRINSLFNKRLPDEPKTFDELIDFLKKKKDKIDYDVNNCVMLGEPLKIEILATPGDLILEIPAIIEKAIPELTGIKFVYLIDEYENIKEEQQKYINTLVREIRKPSSLRIGVRLYGFRTRETYSAKEQIKSGAEVEEFALDKYFQGKKGQKNYRDFASKLCVRRLKSSFSICNEIKDPQDAFTVLNEYFEKPGSNPFEIEQTRFVLDRYKNEERPYFDHLRRKLSENFNGCEIKGVSSQSSINEIISNLRISDKPLVEKFNVFSIYQAWFQKKDLLEASQEIKSEGTKFVDNPGMKSEYALLFKKWKFDLLSQLFRECDQRQKYLGLETFIDLSHGLPRNLLVILKNIYNWSIFNGEEPFKKSKISERSQLAGVKEASYWFLKDAEIPGINFFQTVEPGIRRLCEFFRELRFADKPVEVSLASFCFDLSATISEDARKTIEWAEKTSLLIGQQNERKDKNSLRIDRTYALNRMLSPMWDLPVARRTVLLLATNEVEAIFAPKKEDEFKEILNRRRVRMNAPFKELEKQPTESEKQRKLFEV